MTELDAMLGRLHMPTVRRLWSELQVRAEKEGMGYAAYLETLMAEEIAHRQQTRVQRETRWAKFPFLRTIEEFDFNFQSGLRKELLGSYLGPELVSEGRNLIAYGPSGTGKTHVAVAIAYKAIQNGSDARFATAAHLLEDLSTASREGRLREALIAYTHPGVLVVDEVGYLSLGPDAANVLFQVVNERYLHRRAMVFTTNKAIEEWGKVLHDADLAEAILDRLLERGRVLHFKGPSFRTRHLAPKAGAIISGKDAPEFRELTHGNAHRSRDCHRGVSSSVEQGLRARRIPFARHTVGRDGAADPLELRGRQGQVDRGRVLLEIAAPLRPWDGDDLAPAAQDPGQGELGGRMPRLAGHLHQPIDESNGSLRGSPPGIGGSVSGSLAHRTPRPNGPDRTGSRGRAGCTGRIRCRALGTPRGRRSPGPVSTESTRFGPR